MALVSDDVGLSPFLAGILDPRCQLCVFMGKQTHMPHATSSSPCSWFPWIPQG